MVVVCVVVVLVVVVVGLVVVVVLVVDVVVRVVLVGRVPDEVPVGAASPHPGGGVGVVFPREGVGEHVDT